MNIVELRAEMDRIVGEPRRKQFFQWLMTGSGRRYLMYCPTEGMANEMTLALTSVGLCAGFYPSQNFPQQYTVWIAA